MCTLIPQSVHDIEDDCIDLFACYHFPSITHRNKQIIIDEHHGVLNNHMISDKNEAHRLKYIFKRTNRMENSHELIESVKNYWYNHPEREKNIYQVEQFYHKLIDEKKEQCKSFMLKDYFRTIKNISQYSDNESDDETDEELTELSSCCNPTDPTHEEIYQLLQLNNQAMADGFFNEYDKETDIYIESLDGERPSIIEFEKIYDYIRIKKIAPILVQGLCLGVETFTEKLKELIKNE